VLELDRWIEGLIERRERIGSDTEVCELCSMACHVLGEESNVVRVASPVTICGDIHGQFGDLLELFRICGKVPEKNYVFLGDYVDRGRDSLEVFELLLCLKVRWPNHVTLLRGNHESRQITQVYGFYDECIWKYGSALVWRECCKVFDLLTICALIDNCVLCVHGGLSPYVPSIHEIHCLERNKELPVEGPICDMLWSDPAEDDQVQAWSLSNRGAGYLFGAKAVETFHYINNTELLCRAHQLVMSGYKFHFSDQSCLTIWSAPNYCGRCGNLAAALSLPESNFLTFNSPAV